MPFVLAILLVIVAIALLFWLSFNVLAWVVTLLVAGLVGWLADVIVPGRLPWGWLGAILAGLVGSWLGVALFGRIGPDVGGISIISALIGAIILAIIANLLFRATTRERYV